MDAASTPETPRSAPYELFMLGISLYVLLALAAETLLPLDPGTRAILEYSDTAICFIFLADFFRNLVCAQSRLGYLKWGWIDLLSSIPMVDALRVGRAARIVRIIRVLRGFRSMSRLSVYLLQRRAQAAFAGASLVSIMLVVFSSIAILQFEPTAAAGNIRTPQEALWWAWVTVTTVGYGDKFPVTLEGRVIAAVLMTAGVGLFGTFTGFVATWFLAPGEKEEQVELKQVWTELALLRASIEKRQP